MLLIIDKVTNQEIKTHDMNKATRSPYLTDEALNDLLAENEKAIEVNDEITQKILNAYEYELTFSGGVIVDVIVNKSLEEFQAEQPIEPQPPTEIEELTNYMLEVDFRLITVEMGLQ